MARLHYGLKPVVRLQYDPPDSSPWKYHIPFSIPKLQPVSNTVWRKKAGFYQLASAIYGLSKSHYVVNTIYLITHKSPIEKFTAQQEAAKVMHKVQHYVFDVNHLQAILFLNTSGKKLMSSQTK